MASEQNSESKVPIPLAYQGEGQKLRKPAEFTLQPDPTIIVPQVRKCSWESFINRFSSDEPIYAVEALISGDNLGKEMLEEASKRTNSGHFLPADYAAKARVNKMYAPDSRVQRVRIQSPTLLAVFSRVTADAWATKSYTFMEPFQHLTYHHDALKQELSRIEETLNDSNCSADPRQESSMRREVQELKAYIEFAETDILIYQDRLRGHMISGSTKVRFHDLSHLFRPGDLIYMPDKTLSRFIMEKIRETYIGFDYRALQGSGVRQKIWRVYDVQITPPDPSSPVNPEITEEWFWIPRARNIYNRGFDGLKEIRSLDFYPLRCAKGGPELLQEHRKIGATFLSCREKRHMKYSGWTYTTDPMGWPLAYPREAEIKYIDSEVIIDFQEAYGSNPKLRSKFSDDNDFPEFRKENKTTSTTDLLVVWSDKNRSKVRSVSAEAIFVSESVSELQKVAYLEHEVFLNSDGTTTLIPEGDDLALLPPRVCAYSLKDSGFYSVDPRLMKPVDWGNEGFAALQLEESHKAVIQSSVRTHLRQRPIERVLENEYNGNLCSQDFIKGKGRGLIIMLHGEPGTGKTATAEVVAQAFKRPLFPLSCGHLDNPTSAEAMLNQVFRLADLWSCILLIDEADVFLSARTSADSVLRNSLVSVFLRKLEYYNGILFLTTNRIGKIDQAISSRLQLVLHYKRFNKEAFEGIFRINIERLQKIELQQSKLSGEKALVVVEKDILAFVSEHWAKHPNGKGAWNGRQIRNAFTIAAGIARDEAEQESADIQPQLRSSHFKQVEKLMDEYAQFRLRVLGKDDAQRALLNEERDDDYEGEVENGQVSKGSNLRLTDAFSHAALPSIFGTYGTNPMGQGYQNSAGAVFAPSPYGQNSQPTSQWGINSPPGYPDISTSGIPMRSQGPDPAAFMGTQSGPDLTSQGAGQHMFNNVTPIHMSNSGHNMNLRDGDNLQRSSPDSATINIGQQGGPGRRGAW